MTDDKRHPARPEHDQEVVEDIRRLSANRVLIQRRGGDRQFDRFFAEFARAMGRALVEQAAGIGRFRARARALVDRSGKLLQREHRAIPVHFSSRAFISRCPGGRNRPIEASGDNLPHASRPFWARNGPRPCWRGRGRATGVIQPIPALCKWQDFVRWRDRGS